MAKDAHSLPEQPLELRDRLRLPAVLGEIEVDELTQPRRLDQSLLAPLSFELPLQRLDRGLLGDEPASLNAPCAAPAETVTVRPCSRFALGRPLRLKHLSLLHNNHLSFRVDDERRSSLV